MSPEQARGEAVDARTDLFSLGSVLYAMCTGRPPFRAGNNMAVLKRVCEEAPTPIRETNPEVPDWLCAIVAKLQAKNPAERYQSAAEVAAVLGEHLARVQHPSVVPVPAVKPAAAPVRRARRWVAAAVALLALVAGLGVAEATGTTNVRATVIRIFTPDGTLVVETDDPAVKVVVEGDGDLVITGTGAQEVRLRAGSYRLKATRDGKEVKLDRDLVTISKGDRQIVKVRLEADPSPALAIPPATAIPPAAVGAFVVLGGKGVEVGKFDTLAEAVKRAADGDTIEIRDNGPFVTDPIDLGPKALTIRAGASFVPVIKPSPAAVRADAALLRFEGALTLEGLEVHHYGLPEKSDAGYPERRILYSHGAPLYLSNCKLFVNPGKRVLASAVCGYDSLRGHIRNCLIVSKAYPGYGVILSTGTQWTVENCLIVTDEGPAVAIGPDGKHSLGTNLRLSRNTLVSQEVINVGGPEAVMVDARLDPTAKSIPSTPIEADGNVCQVGSILGLNFVSKNPTGVPVDRQRKALEKLIRWRERDSVYQVTDEFFLYIPHPPARLFKSLGEWDTFWGLKDTGCAQGVVRMRGNPKDRIATAPEAITPDDFRLRPDSAGYQADKNKKDLGADVDLVGPGAAYEKWKKTPDYQQWLKDIGQIKSVSPKEPGAFVVLGGQGVAERKYDTLADAVKWADDKDTIEIRGNGPFLTDPIDLGPKVLVIRAGPGYLPVIKSNPAVGKAGDSLLSTRGSLTLEGLELRYEERPEEAERILVYSSSAPLSITNCKLIVRPGKDLQPKAINAWESSLRIRNSLIVSPNYGVLLGSTARTQAVVENCLIAASVGFSSQTDEENAPGTRFRLSRNTWTAGVGWTLQLPGVALCDRLLQPTPKPVVVTPVVTEGNVWQVRNVFGLNAASTKHPQGLPAEEQRRIIPSLLRWRHQDDVYALEQEAFVSGPPTGFLKNLAEWNQYWELKDTGSLQGRILLRGNPQGLLESNPDAITPAHFRLRADSAGAQAAKDKKDLGADVELVGPGAAYEKWKKTPEYQQWLKDTRQRRARPEPKPEPGAFVLLGGKGVEVAKFDTLAAAVSEAQSDDTIEIRGNGPFLTNPIDLGNKALTIRAGAGFVPVIRPSPAALKAEAQLLLTAGRLTLEGLELHYAALPETNRGLIGSVAAPLYLTNCKLVLIPGKGAATVAVETTNPTRALMRNCLVVAPGNAFLLHDHPRMLWTIDNCLVATTTAFYVQTYADTAPGTKLRLNRNTLVCVEGIFATGPDDALADRLRDPAGKPVVPILIDVEENVWQTLNVLNVRSESEKFPKGRPVEEQRKALTKLVQWRERGNAYGLAEEPFLNLRVPPTGLLKNLTEWNAFWGLKDTGSLQGPIFFRDDPMALMREVPEDITPDDFRLLDGSAGYRARKDKKDLGADVDLVGPGAAYEKWKKTPEYQQWLADTGPLKK
jgi:hypothetical protein